MATLEFVMSLPILMLMIVSILAVGWAMIRKSDVAVASRHDAWARRPGADSDQGPQGEDVKDHPCHPLAVVASPASGETLAVAKAQFSMPSWLGSTVTAESRNAVLLGSWDYREVPEMAGQGPHFGALAKIAVESVEGGGEAIGVGGLQSLKQLLELGISDAFMKDAQDANQQGSKAQEDSEKERKKAEEILAQLRKEREQKIQQREALQKEVNDLKQQRAQLYNDIAQLKTQTTGDPPQLTPEAAAAIKKKQEEIAKLNTQINAKEKQIGKLNGEIAVLNDQIEAIEDKLEEGDQQMGQLSP